MAPAVNRSTVPVVRKKRPSTGHSSVREQPYYPQRRGCSLFGRALETGLKRPLVLNQAQVKEERMIWEGRG